MQSFVGIKLNISLPNVEGHTTNKLNQMFLMDFEIEKVTQGEIWCARGNALTLLVFDWSEKYNLIDQRNTHWRIWQMPLRKSYRWGCRECTGQGVAAKFLPPPMSWQGQHYTDPIPHSSWTVQLQKRIMWQHRHKVLRPTLCQSGNLAINCKRRESSNSSKSYRYFFLLWQFSSTRDFNRLYTILWR